jgi:hypothetical protein
MSSIEKMKENELAFRDAYEHTFSHFPDATRRNVVLKFVSGITMQYSLYLAFTSDGLSKLMKDVFSNDTIRDFVLRLTGAFFTRLGTSTYTGNELPDVLASALCVFPTPSNNNNISSDVVAVPEELKNRLPEYDDVKALLLANKWLVTVAMLSLYLRIEIEDTKKK